MLSQTYQTRPISFLELWHFGDWRLKLYGIAHGCERPVAELLTAAKTVAGERLSVVPSDLPHYHLGFVGVHQGRTSNFVFVDWWANENELHHHVYVSSLGQPLNLEYKTPTGLVACVWDLRVICFEREAWLSTVLCNPGQPDFELYLGTRLDGSA